MSNVLIPISHKPCKGEDKSPNASQAYPLPLPEAPDQTSKSLQEKHCSEAVL